MCADSLLWSLDHHWRPAHSHAGSDHVRPEYSESSQRAIHNRIVKLISRWINKAAQRSPSETNSNPKKSIIINPIINCSLTQLAALILAMSDSSISSTLQLVHLSITRFTLQKILPRKRAKGDKLSSPYPKSMNEILALTKLGQFLRLLWATKPVQALKSIVFQKSASFHAVRMCSIAFVEE